MANKYKIAQKIWDEYCADMFAQHSDYTDDTDKLYSTWLNMKSKETKGLKLNKNKETYENTKIDKELLKQLFDLFASGNKTNKITDRKKANIVAKIERSGIENPYLNYAINEAITRKIANIKWIKSVAKSAKIAGNILPFDVKVTIEEIDLSKFNR